MNRLASTRSDEPASQSWTGRPQCSVGSIDADGIRYGLTTQPFSASTISTAKTIVSPQSSADRWRLVRFGKRRSRSLRIGALRDGGCELAADQRDRLEVVVCEVLQHHALEADRLDLPQPVDDPVDRADRPALAVALQHLVGLPAEAGSDPSGGLVQRRLVLTDHGGSHQGVAQRGRIAAGPLARLVELRLALAELVGRREEGVVLVGEADGRAGRSGPGAAPDEQGEVRTAQPRGIREPVVLAGEVDAFLVEEAM